jgi:hypothetical protein
MDLPLWTAEEIAAQAARLGAELTAEAVADLRAAVETAEPTLVGLRRRSPRLLGGQTDPATADAWLRAGGRDGL